MAKMVVGLFADLAAAEAAVRGLLDAGFPGDSIGLVARDDGGQWSGELEAGQPRTEDQDIADQAWSGAGAGALAGGLGGLLVGLAALAIPGIGPAIAAGPVVAALTGAGLGAAAGGLVGALVEVGIPNEPAESYAEGVRRGGVLLTLRSSNTRAAEAVEILNRYNPIDIEHIRREPVMKEPRPEQDLETRGDQEAGERMRDSAWQAPWNANQDIAPGVVPGSDLGELDQPGMLAAADRDRAARDEFPSMEAARSAEPPAAGAGGGRETGREAQSDSVAWPGGEVPGGGAGAVAPLSEPDWASYTPEKPDLTTQVGEDQFEHDMEAIERQDPQSSGRTRLDRDMLGRDVNEQIQPSPGVRDLMGDRPAHGRMLKPFEEGSFELDETTEWVVIRKEARIVEEVHLRREESELAQTGAGREYDEFEPLWRSHYASAVSRSDYSYASFLPAYRYGHQLAHNDRFRGQDWAAVEGEARRDWEARHPDRPWEDFKAAVKSAFEAPRRGM